MKQGSNTTLYIIIGAMAVVLAILAYFMIANNDDPELEIRVGDERITVDTD